VKHSTHAAVLCDNFGKEDHHEEAIVRMLSRRRLSELIGMIYIVTRLGDDGARRFARLDASRQFRTLQREVLR
jgi:hypothetical protein